MYFWYHYHCWLYIMITQLMCHCTLIYYAPILLIYCIHKHTIKMYNKNDRPLSKSHSPQFGTPSQFTMSKQWKLYILQFSVHVRSSTVKHVLHTVGKAWLRCRSRCASSDSIRAMHERKSLQYSKNSWCLRESLSKFTDWQTFSAANTQFTGFQHQLTACDIDK